MFVHQEIALAILQAFQCQNPNTAMEVHTHHIKRESQWQIRYNLYYYKTWIIDCSKKLTSFEYVYIQGIQNTVTGTMSPPDKVFLGIVVDADN